jgi:hypothetical protein
MRIIAFVLDQAPAITDWPELDQTAGRGGGRGEWAVNVPIRRVGDRPAVDVPAEPVPGFLPGLDA